MYNLPSINTTLSKSDLTIIAESFVAEVSENGKVIEGAELLTKMEFLIEKVKKDNTFIEMVRDEIAKFGKDHITSTGTKIELAEVGTKYDYQNCGDKIYNQLIADQELISQKIKEREKFLKSLPQEGMDTFDENGEVFKLYPPAKNSKSSFKTTLAK